MDELEAKLRDVQVRIGNGIEWLTVNDPKGVYHLWYTSGILPYSPMPAQPAEVREQYQRYYAARKTFDSLERQEEQLQKRLKPS